MPVTVEVVLSVIATLIGVPAAIALLVDVLKWAGVVKPENAGKASAVLNLVALIAIIIVLELYPQIDVPSMDRRIMELVKLVALIFQYILMIAVSKTTHQALKKANAFRLYMGTAPKAG